MTEDGPTVLVAGTEWDRVDGIASSLASAVAVRTYVGTDSGTWNPADVEVVVFTDPVVAEEHAPGELPADAARVAVFEDREMVDGDRPMAYDRVVVEPLASGSLTATVTSLARRVQYDRRLGECAELAARCGRTKSNASGRSADPQLHERVADAKAELDDLLAEFSSDDFRQAFRTLAAD